MGLEGVRVGVTASRPRCEALSFLLEEEGAQLLHLPLLELLPPADERPFAAMVEQLQRIPWILLSSLEAVTALWEGARVAGSLDRLDKVGLIASDASVAQLLESLGQPARMILDDTGALPLEPDAEVLVPAADPADPWPARLAEGGALARAVLAWRPGRIESQPVAPELLVIDSVGAACALHRDHPAWLHGAVRVAGSPAVAAGLGRLEVPAAAVAAPGAEGLLDAVRASWKR